MNLSISEKEVDYRINNQYKKKRSIGEYIRKERLAQGLKQELVCKGVCSVSYFSRIESNKVNPPEIYITKIFERLNKPIPENLDIENYYKENINNFISAIEYKNDRLVDEEYNKILNIPDINKDLYEFVYLIYYKKINDLEPLLLKLHQQQVHFDNDELLLYLENVGSYYVIKNEYENAMRCISISLKLQDYLGIKKPSILYKYAWILGKYNNDYQCLKYAEEAERLYSNQNNIYRSLQSKLLIGIKLSKYFPERAIELYQNCIRITNHSNYRGLIKVIKYNLAMVYKKCNNYVKSEKLFNELISTYSDDNNYVFDVFVELIDLHLLCNNIKNAKKCYETMSKLDIFYQKQSLYITYLNYKIYSHDIDDKIKRYVDDFIPFFEKSSKIELLIRSRLELSKIYEDCNDLDASLREMKRVLQIVEEYMLGGI